MKRVTILLCLGVFLAVSCEKSMQEPPVSNVSFTPCQQEILRSSSLSDKVDVEFTSKGVQITYNDFAVTCDFTTVNVTHTFKNGVLNITQQGYPNQADCICYTDVSYTIDGISKNEVNVIFINDVQVYCYHENYPIEIPFEEYSLHTSCQWKNLNYDNTVVVINSHQELSNYINCVGIDFMLDEDYFSKHTLLLACGITNNGIHNIEKQFIQIGDNQYSFNVTIQLTYAEVLDRWQIVISVDKLSDNAEIVLSTITEHF